MKSATRTPARKVRKFCKMRQIAYVCKCRIFLSLRLKILVNSILFMFGRMLYVPVLFIPKSSEMYADMWTTAKRISQGLGSYVVNIELTACTCGEKGSFCTKKCICIIYCYFLSTFVWINRVTLTCYMKEKTYFRK